MSKGKWWKITRASVEELKPVERASDYDLLFEECLKELKEPGDMCRIEIPKEKKIMNVSSALKKRIEKPGMKGKLRVAVRRDVVHLIKEK